MFRTTLICGAITLLVAQSAPGIIIKQLNDQLDEEPGDQWDFNPSTGAITIKESSNQTYVFYSHVDNEPDTLAAIERITLEDLTSGTVRVKISKTFSGLTPGATTITAILIDDGSVTSVLEGVAVTGNFLTTAMTVDQVTGPIEVGGSLLSAMTVLEDLEGEITIADFTTVGADIEIVGDALEPLSIGTYISGRTDSLTD